MRRFSDVFSVAAQRTTSTADTTRRFDTIDNDISTLENKIDTLQSTVDSVRSEQTAYYNDIMAQLALIKAKTDLII